METKQILRFLSFCALLAIGFGCSISGTPNWNLLQTAEVLDTHEGVFEERDTTDIIRVINAVPSNNLNNGPYVDAVLIDSTFVIRTNENFRRYEEYETAQNFTLTVTFECAGSNPNLVFFIMVTDTNNNDPIFRPEDVFEFIVMPPLPPGYKITNFLPLTVRDIDLTTQRIDFEIFDSTNFAIAYDDASSTTAKEFRAALSTTTFIRNIPEPIEFTIRATDVDLTGDPQRSRIATVRIISDGSFELPEELVFTQTFYMANLNTENNEIVLQEPISLRQGYHEEVQFSLSTGEHSSYFEIVPNGNSVTLRVTESIPTEVLSLRKLFLVVRADRQYTSGTSATVILQLPEEINLQFENPIYVGTIEDNAFELSDLVLSQGYENQIVSVEIKSDYASNFGFTIAVNRITLTMSPLDDNIIQQNTFLNLKVVASTPMSSASTVVTLEIIKDDSVTPVFERALYTGTYYNNDGLSIEQITLIQGFDDSVEISLSGDHKELFQLVRNGPNSNLVASTLPPELFREQQILLTIEATKPRTVGATAAISISLPAETLLEFEQLNYIGNITDNILSVEDLVLRQGYENEVINIEIQHEHSSYFNYVINENRISLSMSPLDASIIAGNSFLNLVVIASTSRSSASTTVTLDIVNDDTTTPVFERAVYSGSYDPVNGLSIEQITILQGHDNTVEVTLEGEHKEYFQLLPTGPNIEVTTSSVPSALFPLGSLLLTIVASKPRTVGANAAIYISLPAARELRFSQEAYRGSIQDNSLILGPVTISTGYADDIKLTLSGDYESYFQPLRDQNQISIQLTRELPESVILENNFMLLTLLASAPHAISTTTTISLDLIKEDTSTPVFNEKIYNVVYSSPTSFQVPDIFLTQGYDENVSFRIAGEHAEHFAINPSGNSVGLSIPSGIPEELIFNEKVLIFNIIADKPLTIGARAAISVSFPSDLTEPTALAFSKNIYTGSLRNDDDLVIENIELNVGFTTDTQFSLNSEYEAYFQVNNSLNTVTISLTNTLPPEILNSKFVALELNARRERAVPVTSTVIIDIIQTEAPIPPVFSGTFYRATYTKENVLQFEREIYLSEGFDNTVSLELEGDYNTWFEVTNNENVVLITTNGIPESILNTNNHLVFAVVAHKTGAITGRATIVVDLPIAETPEVVVLGFTQASYTGRIQDNTLELPPVTLAGIYDMALALKAEGDYAPYFKFTRVSSVINIELSDDFPSEVSSNLIVIDLQISYPDAITGFTTLVIELVTEPEVQIVTPVFEQAYYVGQYSEQEALVFAHSIQLIQGFDETVSFSLEGDDRIYFSLTQIAPNSYSLTATNLIQQIDNNRSHLLLSVVATKPGTVNGEAAIVIALTGGQDISVTFDNVLYKGRIQGGVVQHETITLTGYEKDQVDIIGTYGSFFTARHSDGLVVVERTNSLTLPDNIEHVVLELRADDAASVLVLDIVAGAEPPVVPTVSFSSTSYAVRVEMGQTGAVGQVEATADNGERVTYSLQLSNENLQSRLSVSSEGELRLSAPADIGVYNFEVIATTIFTGATGSATINFAVEAIITCGDDIKTAPLIVIDRDEEEAHRNLVVIDPSEHDGCQYSLTNMWPADHNWLYVDETGLHAHIIDREDPAIAFMALSQIQVELTLHCNAETRTKRSTRTIHDWLGPYDYGSNTWLLGNSIEFNPRRTIVNLIVNDINDNTPKFDQEEPIVGYPVADLASTIAPRALIELHATDADVGENAALLYWSPEPQLAVSPLTGLVHVRNDSALIDGMELSVSATDRNGQGRTGTIILTVKLLSTSNIAVLTVDNAFLEDETLILSNLSNALGYEVKSLRSDILPDSDSNQEASSTDSDNRKKREVTSTGASLVIHVYGLIEREPVIVERLSNDISENAGLAAYTISSIITLEEHLAGMCTISGGNIGLLVATIVLSVLLFLFIAAAVVLFIYVRRKGLIYEKFSDTNSLASKIESPIIEPKPDGGNSLPRLNIEELKRSEKRLQDMLHAPLKEVNVEPSTSANNPAIIPAADTKIPIIIQDKLKDVDDSDEDEFGERKKGRRKSVVTFNENVEKIIHVEDNPEESVPPEAEYEVYKL